MDYYELLGIEPDADIHTIAGAVGRMELNWDLNLKGSPESMLLVSEAWAVLSDEESRRRYDAWRAASIETDGEAEKMADYGAPESKPRPEITASLHDLVRCHRRCFLT